MHILCVGAFIKNPNIGDFDGKLLKPNTYTLTQLCDSKDILCEQTNSAQLFHKREVYVISMSNTTSLLLIEYECQLTLCMESEIDSQYDSPNIC